MTVAELIRELQAMPGEAMVTILGAGDHGDRWTIDVVAAQLLYAQDTLTRGWLVEHERAREGDAALVPIVRLT
jgi:hypothetical protein